MRSREPLVDIEHPGGEHCGLGGAEQMAVVLERGAAPGRVDQDGGIAGQRGHHLASEAPRLVGKTGVGVQRAATCSARAGKGNAGAGGFDHSLGSGMHRPQPGVHHAPSEQPHIGPTRRETRPAQWEPG